MAKKQAVDKTVQEEQREKLLTTLAELGGQSVSLDTLKFQGQEMVIPESMEIEEAIDFLKEWQSSQEQTTTFTKRFNYRPWDGAHAVQSAMRKFFGSSGVQQAEYIFWSKVPPKRIEINVGYGQTEQVPWGGIRLPLFDGIATMGTWTSPTFGDLFQMNIEAAKKYEPHAQSVFTLVERELQTASIYRGKAVDGADEPNFLDLSTVDEERVIYSEEALDQLEANIWALLRKTDIMRRKRMPLKRSVLLHGPYGTGKTLAAFRTAQVSTEHEWTFIYCRPGVDNLKTVLQTARLYQPCVVFAEDLDTVEAASADSDSDVVSQLLDAFDGITTKGVEIIMVLTTNHPDRINKAMLRPGRLDAVVEIGALDQKGVQRMIEALVPAEDRIEKLGYAAIYGAMEGFMPAFVKEAIDRAIRYSIARDDGDAKLTTHDFVRAAEGLRAQLNMMMEAAEPKTSKSFETAVRGMVREAVHGVGVENDDGRAFELNAAE